MENFVSQSLYGRKDEPTRLRLGRGVKQALYFALRSLAAESIDGSDELRVEPLLE
jgi:hypothetical protein